ncbi:hypothetical protein JZM58_10505 [Pseudomonas fluorescens]|nr:hypothetical protein JZM58_10505 [Pseudomonas fluorescens]
MKRDLLTPAHGASALKALALAALMTGLLPIAAQAATPARRRQSIQGLQRLPGNGRTTGRHLHHGHAGG